MANIQLVDVSIRDGNQSLWGATGINTAQALQAAPLLDRVGFRALDFTSSTHMGIAVRTHKEDPWEMIRLMHAAAPNTPLQLITTGFRFISWETADIEFMQLAYRCLIRNGVSRFAVVDPMHDMDALLEVAKRLRIEGAAEIMAGLTYTISDIHTDQFYADAAARLAQSPNVDRLYIKDPAGMLTPERARALIPAVRARLGGKALELHSHCTIGLGPLTALSAADLGVEVVHVALGPLANGTSHPDAQRLVANLRELGHTVDIDDRALALATDYFTRLAQAEGLPVGRPQEFDAAFLRHQIPGGVMTTMQRQLEELKLQDKLPAVMQEIERVRSDLGDPIMVTPFPQMVCTQALFNVIGKERYDNIPDQLIRYVIGKFGRPTRPVNQAVLDRIHSLPRTKELMNEPMLTLADARKKFPAHLSDEEFILRAVMPDNQVDAMLATGPAKRHYNPDARPLIALLREIQNKPRTARIVVEKPGFKLELRRAAKS